MSSKLFPLAVFTALCSLIAAPALAQDEPLPASAPPPANLSFVDGGVDLVHDGVAETAVAGVMLVEGDIVRTANGRAEIVFADGTLLHLDAGTELEMLSPLRLRLSDGRIMLRVSAAATRAYTIDTQAASVQLEPRGEYGLATDGRLERLELTVARGVAQIVDGAGGAVVRGGEMATIAGPGSRVVLDGFNSARWDAFARWSNDRANGFTTSLSARQLPYELRPYGPLLDNYGRWDFVAPHGYVWFPSVGIDWRPYYTGAWSLTRYGWTWIGGDPWAWPTQHFGRWGFTGTSWFWIPNRVWGPAWVSWSLVPGYVSWCPLGWDGRPVLGLHGRPGDHPAYWPNYDPWRAWTVVPRNAFGGRRAVGPHAIDPRQLPEQTRRVFTSSGTTTVVAPVEHAVPRRTVSATASGGATSSLDVAVPRSSVGGARPGSVRSPRAAPQPEGPATSIVPQPAAPSRQTEPVSRVPGAWRRPDVIRGGVREPGAGAAAYGPVPPVIYQGPRPQDRGPQERGGAMVRPIAPPGGSWQGAAGVYTPQTEPSRSPREGAAWGGAVRSPGYAVPRPTAPPTGPPPTVAAPAHTAPPPPPPPPSSSSSSRGESGGARAGAVRRPPPQ